MPRQIDLFPQNLQVNNDPTNQISVTSAQIANLNDQIPVALEKAEIAFINAVLQGIDDATGWDLLSFAQQVEASLPNTGDLGKDLFNYLLGTNTLATEANAVATEVWNDLVAFLSTGDWSDLTSAWNALMRVLFGTSTSSSVLGSISAPSVSNTPASVQPVSNFPNSASIAAGGGWAWDGTTSFDGSGGSVEATASGNLLALRGVMAAVQAGQVVTLSTQLQWSGLTYSGSDPIQLQLIPYAGTTTPGAAGAPVTVAQIGTPGASGSWTEIGGTYTIPSSGVGFVQMRLVVQNASAGSVWWADCTETIAGGFLALMQSDLSQLQDDSAAAGAAFTTLLQAWGAAITNDSGNWTALITDFESAWNTYSTTISELESDEIFTLQQLFGSLFGIDTSSGLYPATQVQGVGGLQNLETTFDTMWNQGIAALQADLDAVGLSGWAQSLGSLAVQANNTQAAALSAAAIQAIVNNQPVAAGLEATVESNGDYHQAASLSTELVAKTTSRGTCITISQAKTLGFIQWIGDYTVSPVGFVINFYKMDSSGNLTWLFTSADLSATVSSGVAWYLWDLSTPITVNAGDVVGVEFQIKTSGDINAYGYTAPVAASHPTAVIKQLGFTQNWSGAASTISSGSIGWSQYAPYVGLGVGTPPATPFFPQTTPFVASSTHTIPVWAEFIDLVGVGGGGGGQGDTLSGNGSGGGAGSWGTQTLVVGTDIAASGTITVTVGSGGEGAPYLTSGSNGTATTFSWTNPTLGAQTLTASGGLGGTPPNLLSLGLSPGNQVFEGSTYFGGASNFGGVGNPPGAGGSGGTLGEYGFAGANGQAWIVDRQT